MGGWGVSWVGGKGGGYEWGRGGGARGFTLLRHVDTQRGSDDASVSDDLQINKER